MFRLIKLAIYAAAGYLMYEFVRGMMGEAQGGGGGGGGGQQQQGAESNYRQRAELGGIMGGQDPQGMAVPTQDPDGASMTERVGRGVIPQR